MGTAKEGAPCFECGIPADHDHHVVPKVLGGQNTLPLCHSCHGKAHGLHLAHKDLTRAGIALYKAKHGRWGPAPRADYKRICDMYAQGCSTSEISRRLNVCRNTVRKAISRK